MVVLLDLDDEGPEDIRPSDTPDVKASCLRPAQSEVAESVEPENEPQTNDSGFARALACYPWVTSGFHEIDHIQKADLVQHRYRNSRLSRPECSSRAISYLSSDPRKSPSIPHAVDCAHPPL